jgi:hypothetical protein
MFPHATGLDLSCVFGGYLCAVVLENGVETAVVTVKSYDTYSEREV